MKTETLKKEFQNIVGFDITLITFRIQCPECGHIWGVNLNNEFVPEIRFRCMLCGHLVKTEEPMAEIA